MKIIDISREIFTSPCYADDPQPHYRWHKSLYAGDEFNLSVLSMTPHAGTHIDAPVHFIKHGKSVEECSLEKCFGPCTVITISGVLTGEDMDRLLPHCAKRLLIHGNGDAVLELSAARVITENKLLLVGTDGLSIAFNKQEEAVHRGRGAEGVHRELLSNGTVILENLCLDNVPDGNYLLSALPLKMSGVEASPVRAVLVPISNQ